MGDDPWIRSTVLSALACSEADWKDMISRKRVVYRGALKAELDETEGDYIAEFLSDAAPKCSSLFFYIERIEEADNPAAGAPRLRVALDTEPEGALGVRQVIMTKAEHGAVTDASDSAQVEFSVQTGDSLLDLAQVIREVYIPLLESPAEADKAKPAPAAAEPPPTAAASGEEESEGASLRLMDSMRNELRSNMSKFEAQITRAIQQVSGDVHLDIPDVDVSDPSAVSDDYGVVVQLEGALEKWSVAVAHVVEQETRKVPQRAGPLAEIDFWRQRNAALSTLYEQIQMPNVQKMLGVLELVEAALLPNFQFHFSELTKLYVEAKDNVKFLTTLERHFKNISGGNLTAILDTLPSMMNAIRMVWIISRHYNTDERMVPLMERIASEIAAKVKAEIKITIILRKEPDAALAIIDGAKEVLEKWFSTYMAVRERIEASGTDHRWEFDRKRLFEQTNYMARICENLHEVAVVLDQFHKFLGPELKAVTGDSQGIDEVVRRVEGLVGPLEQLPFDIFNPQYKTSWDTVIAQFREKVDEIEDMTKNFIDTSFQKLRSAEGAFDLLQNFQNIQSRDSINRQMMEKFDDILLQYTKELERFAQIFRESRDAPPVYKNYPPVAGGIAWAQSLYYRAKKPIMRFRTMENLFQDSDTWQNVMAQYVEFAREIKDFCSTLFYDWKEKAHATSLLLQQPILGPDLVEVPGQNGEPPTFKLPPGPFFVNFSPELLRLIRETKYLDRAGYEVPEAALNAALQEDKYHEYVQSLDVMLRNYEELLSGLTTVERQLLGARLVELQEILYTGFDPCNWCSLHIPTLIERCNKGISEFQSVVSQIHKSSSMIEDVVRAIESTELISESDFDTSEVLEVSEFFEKMEKARVVRLEGLVRKYRSIGPLLIKVEEIVAFTNSGASPVLVAYYCHWEKKLYNAIIKMIIVAMATFQGLLNVRVQLAGSAATLALGSNDEKRLPLCKIKASLNGSDVTVTPALNDIYKFMRKSVNLQVESAKVFVRWMHGTCSECEPQIVSEDEEPVVFSFYNDISKNPHVIKMMLTLNQAFHRVFNIVHRYLDSWRRYDKAYGLWDTKKMEALAKLADKEPDCNYFDTRLASYERLATMVRAQNTSKDIDFLRIDCYPIAVAIEKKANEWKQEYGRILYEQSQRMLRSIRDEIKSLAEQLDQTPKDIELLKSVLNVVAEVSERSMDMEHEIDDVMERFRTLKQYGVDMGGSKDAALAAVLDEEWRQLVIDSKTKDLRLTKVKDEFREVTQNSAEEFLRETEAMKKWFYDQGPGSSGLELDEGVKLSAEAQRKLGEMARKREELVNAQRLFNLDITVYPALNQVRGDLDKVQTVYNLYIEFKEFEGSMSSMLWTALDAHALLKGAEALEKKLRLLPKDLKTTSTFQATEETVLRFKEGIPLISSLKNDAMKPRHWEKLMEVTGVKFTMDPKTFTLGAIFRMQLSRFEADINDIVNEGMQEAKIENALRAIEEKWKQTNFTLAKYKKGNIDKGFVLRSAEDINLELEDNMLNLQTMAGSRFVGAFGDDVRKWERQLNHVMETIDVWFKVQSKWQYLESIFIGAEDIRMQLPEEAKKFDTVDKNWKTVMTSTAKNPNVIDACHAENRVDTLRTLSEKLDKCQKSLSDYLDTKRNAFPRFFFISDDELLSVLGSSDPTSIQVHLLKLFDNCKLLKFGRGSKTVDGMQSSKGEKYDFRTTSPVDGAVEVWMTGVEREMRATLHQICKEGVFNYAQMDRIKWIEEYLGMTGILGSQIWWTWETEDVFRSVREGNKLAMKEWADKLTAQLNDMVEVVRSKISNHMRKKINSLLIIDVHGRDIIDTFVRDSILDEREFAWESQLRFYWDRKLDDVEIRQCTGRFRYGYEFMGLNGRLVITPLTDRCYMTITQAQTFNLGTAPAGPAGTGKTETVKDLAKGMALPCFVINCGEGLDYKAMGSIFSGLSQIGAWGCFDEFNRINIEVLSVVSAQLQSIQGALNANRSTVDLGLGKEINLDSKVGIFVTMNPGYAGRTELPDNLKACFRPVTMIRPDMMQICEIMLFSEGFGLARGLAKKMTTLYDLAEGQLSKQYHYDFGLRALKSVLVMAGGLKREYSDMPEDLVLMRALRDSNMPKFVFDDVPLFRGLITDLFPGLDCPRVTFEDLKVAIERDLESNGFRHSDEDLFQLQVDKTIQMFETMQTRHTCMIVGPTGGGKTVVLETLQHAMQPAFGNTVKFFIVNPKAQTLPELYGVLDPATRDWTDGVLSNLFRDMNLPLPTGKENELRWMIFDGDVDALWIENMNSVMDDNRLLTLPNGERIMLQPHCAMIMETFDLQYASPATISRCGMVYVDPKNLGYRPFYERWVNFRCPDASKEQEKETLMELFDKYVPKCIDFVLEGMVDDEVRARPTQCIPVTNLSMVKQLCTLLDAMLGTGGKIESRDDMEGLFIFGVVWSIGGSLVHTSRQSFHDMVKHCTSVPLPENLYEAFFDVEAQRWQSWTTRVPEYKEPSPFAFSKILVPTQENVLYGHLLDLVGSVQKPVLFVGEPGTAKTVTIQNYLGNQDQETTMQLLLNFSSRTTAKNVQDTICDAVDKRTGHIYGPPSGKTLLAFIDDLNMPIVDTYGTQQPIALLHMLVGRGCMYDVGKDLDLRHYRDMRYLAAMGPPGGGRNHVDTRFVALFNVFNLTPPTHDVLMQIYSSIINTYLAGRFNSDVISAGSKITEATLALYQKLIVMMPPTPAKFHYVFNLRDLGRVFEGLCLSTSDVFDDAAKFVRLWRNELSRVFFDRLVDDKDVAVADELFRNVLKDNFPEHAGMVMNDPIVFGDFQNAAARVSEGAEDAALYQDIGTYKDVRTIFDEILEFYNIDNKPMTLVLFEMALEHLTRIYRVIRLPRGNALLVGVGGSGKQSLTKLATFAAGYKIFEIQLSRGYGELEFREDLKGLYKMLSDGPVTFLFTDAHVAEEGFLEMINNMLTTGMVPSLLESDEKDAACNSVRDEVKAAGLFETKDNLWAWFVEKARRNLHIILAMSPSGDTLRVRCRNFPGLVSGCVIDWFFPWPEDALQNVANYFLSDEALPDDHRSSIVNHMVLVHQSVQKASVGFLLQLRRNNYVTPKNYLDFIANYRRQMKENKKKVSESIKRLGGGLTKLNEAGTAVERMSKELSEKKVIVDAKTKDCKVLIVDIEGKTKIADEQQKVANAKQIEIEEANIVIAAEKEKADVQLMEALPALEAAAEALNNLRKEDITEIKMYTTPPIPVMNVAMCVLLMKPLGNEGPESEGWKSAKMMLGDGKFLTSLQTYNKDGLSSKQVRKVKTYFRDPDFNYENMKKISTAGAGLLQWVIAIIKYHEVAQNVEPLKLKVRELEKDSAKAAAELKAITAQLAELSEMLAVLTVDFNKANGELQELTEEASLMERRLNAASKLISGLSSEKVRWGDDIAILESKTEKLLGDCLLGASFLSYLGVFTFHFRESLIHEWLQDLEKRSVPMSEGFRIEKLLTTDVEVQKWTGEGLPGDEHSVQNGILSTIASRFPLCIDPQQQAVKWIKNREANNNLTVRTFADSDFMKHLELAIQFGNAFLFENIDEELDPMIDPVLEKNVVAQGAQMMIKLGDKNIEWDPTFRMYLTTKLANPHYTPEIMGKTMIVNYSVTLDGLADQLLNVVVGHERADIEERFAECVSQMSEAAQTLAKLEDSLLKTLASSTGNILDNAELIQTLDDTKSSSVEIKAQLENANFTKDEIQSARKQYYPVAKRASILFFTMAGLSNINSMYETSLASYLLVFQNALGNAKRDAVLENRLQNMIDQSTRQIYDYTCTGIFERHKLMFSMQLACMIMDGDKELNRAELDFFLKGETSIDAVAKNKPASWIPDNGWKDLLRLESVSEPFDGIVDQVKKNIGAWKQWYDGETPETEDLPLGYSEKLNRFQTLLVCRCFRPDRVYNAVKLFIMAYSKLGDKYVQPPVLDFKRIYNQSNPLSPMVFILSPGADPASDIKALSEELDIKNLKSVALGQGQGPFAAQLLETGASRGHWVLLQNCHLLISWLRNLETSLESMTKVHPQFRLWLTTDPTDKFPLGILQRSLKVVTEPPDGLKLNMRSTFAKFDQSTMDDCPHEAYRPLVYVLAYLHAVVQERRKYGKIGWNVSYDFNESDLKVSRRLLSLYLTKAYENNDEMIPWGSLKYLIGDAMYGGRVSDNFDRRVLQTYVNEYFGDFLFDDCQSFYFSQAGFDYELPEDGPIANYRGMVEKLPLSCGPSVFGLHPNAEIGYLNLATKGLWANLIDLQPRTAASGAGKSREEVIEESATGIQEKISEPIDILVVRKQIGLPSPTQVVLLQELERFNVLLSTMASSLRDLKRALIGEIGMSSVLDALATSLFNGYLPAMWRRLCPNTEKPLGSWMGHYQHRYRQYMDWIDNGEPAVIWLSGFHIPESYLSALVQKTCRKRNWPLDKSTLYTKVTRKTEAKEVTEKLESGCYVQGLYLEGAGWDFEHSVLQRQDPKVLVVDLPILQVIPIEASKLKLQNTFRTPVYVTQSRRNAMGFGLVFEADLATHTHASLWTLQGVALSLNTDE